MFRKRVLMSPLMRTPMMLFMNPLLNRSTLQLFSRWTNRRTRRIVQVDSYLKKDYCTYYCPLLPYSLTQLIQGCNHSIYCGLTQHYIEFWHSFQYNSYLNVIILFKIMVVVLYSSVFLSRYLFVCVNFCQLLRSY